MEPRLLAATPQQTAFFDATCRRPEGFLFVHLLRAWAHRSGHTLGHTRRVLACRLWKNGGRITKGDGFLDRRRSFSFGCFAVLDRTTPEPQLRVQLTRGHRPGNARGMLTPHSTTTASSSAEVDARDALT